MKRFLSIVLTLVLVLTMAPAMALTAHAATTGGACGDNLTWTYNNSTCTLTIFGIGPMWTFGNGWGEHKMPWGTTIKKWYLETA